MSMPPDWKERLEASGLPILGATESKRYRLGIMGGTFDPIHYGHIAEIVTWHDAARMAGVAHLVAATRPGYNLDRAVDAIEESGIEFDVTYLEVPALAISSSYLRERVAAGESLRYLTPDPVTGYLHKHRLYGASSRHYGQTGDVFA